MPLKVKTDLNLRNDCKFDKDCLAVAFLDGQTNTDTCANSVDRDETARNEPSHRDLHCSLFIFFLF